MPKRVAAAIFARAATADVLGAERPSYDATGALIWSSIEGEGCISGDAPMTHPLRFDFGPLSACALRVDSLSQFAGHEVRLRVSYRAKGTGTPAVALMLAQFHEGTPSSHRYTTAILPAVGTAMLDLRSASPDACATRSQAVRRSGLDSQMVM